MSREITIKGKDIVATLYDPREESNVHFSTRFSHVGHFKSIAVKGEEILYSPTASFHPFHSDGFPDEFETPIGYDEAKSGECFLKIGVGLERKKEDKAYTNWDMHEIVRRANIEAEEDADGCRFVVLDEHEGYAYRYEKSVCIENGRLIIAHALKNVGKKPLKTLWYSHAFLRYGGKSLDLTLPHGYTSYNGEEYLIKEPNGYSILLDERAKKGVCCNFHVLDGAENRQTLRFSERAVYRSVGDYPFYELQIYVNDRIVSIEPKLTIELQAEEEKKWSTTYELTIE